MTAVAYLRRSRVDAESPGLVSHEEQLSAVRDLAARHGDLAGLVVIEDWGKSGRADKQQLRRGFAHLERMVATREVTAVYAYDLSRLGRSQEGVTRLAHECKEAGVVIRCAVGLSPDVATAEGRLVLNVISSMHEYFAEQKRERAMARVATLRARGEHLGPPPTPPELVAKVREAFESEGGLQATTRRLNRDGVPTKLGGPWRTSTVQAILRRDDPMAGRLAGLRPGRPRTNPPARLAGLLRCACGKTLVSRTYKSGFTAYECKLARDVPDHHRPASVAEAKLLPYLMDQMSRYRGGGVFWPAVNAGKEGEAERKSLLERRQRVVENALDGTIDGERKRAEFEAIDARLAEIAFEAPPAGRVEAPDWSGDPAAINETLRKLWTRVDLGPGMVPVEVKWAPWTGRAQRKGDSRPDGKAWRSPG